MTHRHLDESHLDAEIDRAVREMMSVEPRADLRDRVIAELLDAPTRMTLWPRLALGSAALAAAAVIVLLVVNRAPDRPVDQTIARTVPPASASGSTPGTARPPTDMPPKVVPGGPVVVDVPKPRTVTPPPAIEDRRVQAASLDTTELVTIEPMAAVERLRPLDPIGIPLLDAVQATGESRIKPITIERIEITPLSPPR